jgi:TetR/AcrR family transcriptional regulator
MIKKRKRTAATRTGPAKKPKAAGKSGPRPEPDAEARILEAARTVIIRRGTAGARMQEIAREAGVNQALLHYYFRTKEQLSTAVFEQAASRLFPALLQTLGSDSTLDQKIDRIVEVYLDNMTRNPFLPGYLLSELHHHPERLPAMLTKLAGASPGQIMPPVLKRLRQQIDAAVAAGAMRPIKAEQFAANLISLCIFPFAARPMLSLVFGLDDAAFALFIEERRTELPAFFRNALRP